MASPISFYGETYYDNTKKGNGQPESTSYFIPITTLDATNYVAQLAKIATFSTAIAALVVGNLHETDITIARNLVSDLAAATQAAQRENKFLFRYHDVVTNKKFRFSVGTAKLTALPNHSEFLDLSAGVGLAALNAFQALAVSPDDDGNNVLLDSVQFVGRNT